MVASETVLDYSGTPKELWPVFDKALRLLEERDGSYGMRWVTEPMGHHYENVRRKAGGVADMIERLQGGETVNIDKLKEDLLDMMNYGAIVYKRIELVYERIGL